MLASYCKITSNEMKFFTFYIFICVFFHPSNVSAMPFQHLFNRLVRYLRRIFYTNNRHILKLISDLSSILFGESGNSYGSCILDGKWDNGPWSWASNRSKTGYSVAQRSQCGQICCVAWISGSHAFKCFYFILSFYLYYKYLSYCKYTAGALNYESLLSTKRLFIHTWGITSWYGELLSFTL